MLKYVLGIVMLALALAGLGVFLAVSNYNHLVELKQNVDAQWAEVQNQYQRRSNLIPNLTAVVGGAANFEKSTLIEVTRARASVGQLRLDSDQAPTNLAKLQEFQRTQESLGSALSRLLVVSEQYPELKANENFLNLQVQLEGTENRISFARYKFNTVTQAYNSTIQSFPAVLYAKAYGFTPRPYFEAQSTAEQAPAVNFNTGANH